MLPKTIVVISHNYAPLQNPRAFRWTAICEHWSRQGARVEVVTAWTPGLSRYEELNGVNVHRVGGGLIERLKKDLDSTGVTHVSNSSGAAKQPSILKNALKYCLRKAHDLTWRNLYWPDYACLWITPAVATARRFLKAEHESALVTVSIPFSGHLAGRRLKREFPTVPWLVDVGDPFCFGRFDRRNNRLLYDGLNVRAERQVFNLADYISVTTQSTADEYAKLFPSSAQKLKVIPPLVSLPSGAGTGNSLMEPSDAVKFLVIGTLDPVIRNPEPFLTLLRATALMCPNLEFEAHFVGALKEIDELFNRTTSPNLTIVRHGLCRREAVVRSMLDTDFLVNIGNQSTCQLPSKVVEYVWSGKPIINIARVENDSSSEFLKQYPALLDMLIVGSEPTPAQVERLAGFLQDPPPPVDADIRERLLSDFGPGAIMDAYDRLLRQPVSVGMASDSS